MLGAFASMTSNHAFDPEDLPPRRVRSPLATLVRVAIACALIVGILWTLDVRRLADYMSAGLLLAVVAAQPVLAVGCMIFAVRLRYLVGRDISWKLAFSAFVLPIGLNVLVPARLSELVKPVYLNRAANVPLVEAMAVLVQERALDLVALGLLALVVLPAAYLTVSAVLWLTSAIAIAATVPLLAKLAAAYVVPCLPERLAPLGRFVEALGALDGFGRYGILFTMTLLGWLASLLSVYTVLSLGATQPMTLGQSSTVFLLTILGGLIAVLPAGAGTFQAAAMVGLVSFGLSNEESLILAIALQIAALAFPVAYLIVVAAFKGGDLDLIRLFTRRK